MVISSLGHVPDPLRRSVATLLLNAEVAHSQARACESWHLEVKRDGRLVPFLPLGRWNELHISCQERLCIALESLKAPHNAAAIRLIDCTSGTAREDANLCSIGRDRNLADNIRAEVALFKDGLQTN